jgi:hypothetical protein
MDASVDSTCAPPPRRRRPPRETLRRRRAQGPACALGRGPLPLLAPGCGAPASLGSAALGSTARCAIRLRAVPFVCALRPSSACCASLGWSPGCATSPSRCAQGPFPSPLLPCSRAGQPSRGTAIKGEVVCVVDKREAGGGQEREVVKCIKLEREREREQRGAEQRGREGQSREGERKRARARAREGEGEGEREREERAGYARARCRELGW